MRTEASQVQSYSEFSQSIHSRLVSSRTPIEGTIEVTWRCPLKCVHCLNNLPMNHQGATRSELTCQEHYRILDELAEAGCLWLLYTGGEIFARADFLDIHTYAKKKGFLVTLFTNGTLVTPRIADGLAEWRPFAIEVTLYGRTRETYERLTGIPGSYDKCMRGLALLLERKLPLKLKTVAVSVNKHEVWDMRQYAQELGVPFKFDAMMSPRIDCSQSPLAVRLTPEECVAFDLADPRRVSEWGQFAEEFLRPANPPERAHELYTCGGAVNGFAIDPEGKLSVCSLSQVDKFDLRQGSFQQGWEGFLHRVRRRRVSRVTKCTACQLKSLCGMCPANAQLENNDPEAPVDFLCQVAHLRAYTLGWTVVPHGDCEYCEGGHGYPALMASRERLGSQAAPIRPPRSSSRFPPVVDPASTSASCQPGECSSRGPHRS